MFKGPQRTRSWEKDGIKHRLTEVDADEFLLLDSVNKASEPSPADDAGSQTNWAQTILNQILTERKRFNPAGTFPSGADSPL